MFPTVGDRFAGYLLQSELGRGGFATVFRALAPDGVTVALKVLRPDGQSDDELRRRFAREARLVGSLSGPHTVRLLAHGDDAFCWAAFELVPGRDLHAVLQDHARLSAGSVRHIVLQVATALEEAHRAGIVHRDLKPDNIRVFDGPSGPLTLKVLDFGIARSTNAGHPSVTATGDLIGTPRYMSPEQLRGEPVTAASDIYSLGLMGFELLAGADALPGGGLLEQVHRIVADFKLELPNPSPEEANLLEVLRRMTTPEVGQRIRSMEAVRAALGAGPLPRQQAAVAPEISKRPHRGWFIGAIAVVTGIMIGLAVWKGEDPGSNPRIVVQERVNPLATAPTITPEPTTPELVEEPYRAPDSGGVPDWCSKPVHKGLIRISGTSRDVSVYAPASFDATKSPVVLALLRGGSDSEDATLDYTGLREIVERESVLVVFPEPRPGPVGVTWPRGHETATWAAIQQAALQFCVPEDAPVFVFGHGLAGRVIDEMVKKYPEGPTAVAVAGLRYENADSFVSGVPYLDFSHRKDLFAPPEGGVSQSGDGPYNSIAHRFEHLKSQYQCSGPEEVVWKYEESVCRTWKCATLLQLCDIDGGRYWRANVEGIVYRDGAGYALDIPHAKILWEFFRRAERQRATESPNATPENRR